MRVCLALNESTRWMDSHEAPLSVLLTRMDKVTDRDGCLIDLSDPAVMAFVDSLMLDKGQALNALSIHGALSKRYRSYQNYADARNLPAFQTLVALAVGGGWVELDRLFDACYERTLTSFFDNIVIKHHPEDTEFDGDQAYEIQVITTSNGEDTGLIAHFAMASDRAFAFRLVEMILAGELEVKDPYRPTKPAVVTDIRINLEKAPVFDGVVFFQTDHKNRAVQARPLLMSGSTSDVFGNLSILPYVKPFFASHEFSILKGRLLEDSMGL